MIYKENVVLDIQDAENVDIIFGMALKGQYISRRAWSWFLDRALVTRKEAEAINYGYGLPSYVIIPEENIYR